MAHAGRQRYEPLVGKNGLGRYESSRGGAMDDGR